MKKLFVIGLIALFCACAGNPASSGNSTAGMDLDAAIKEAATQMETRIPSGTLVALVSFASPSTAFSTQILTRLESAIVSSGKLVVVDRANLDKVRAEQGFQLSGEVDDESAKSIGKLLGAGAIVTGSLTDLGDVYSLTLKAINIETATVAVSYLADLRKTTRIATLLATRDGAASGGTTQGTTARTQPASSVASTSTTTSAAPVRFTVTFNANGASGGAPPAHTVQNGESITLPDIGAMNNPRGTFDGWNTRADGNGTPYTAGNTFIVNANTQLYAQWIEQIYRIGDTGPAGGIIFYDKGNRNGGWQYMEVAKDDLGKATGLKINGTNTGIGTGKQNTQVIARSGGMAAMICEAYRGGGFADWFLPSKDELNMMYINLVRISRIVDWEDTFWSSSVVNGVGNWRAVWAQRFSDGYQEGGMIHNEGNNYSIRAVRQF